MPKPHARTTASPTVLLVRNAAKHDFGGAETYQVSLGLTLQKFNYTPIIVTRSPRLLTYAHTHNLRTIRGWWWGWQNWSGIRLLAFPFYVLWQIILAGWYIQLLLRTRAVAIHLQSRDDFIAGSIAGRLLDRQVVWTDHMDLRYVFANISRPLRNPAGKLVFWAARFTNYIILISKNEHRLVTSHFRNPEALATKITLVYNGVIDHRDEYSTELAQTSAHFSYCLASRIVANKGIGEAIEAFKLLLKSTSADDISLDIYGDGADIEAFKELAADTPQIVFHGHQADALRKIARADVFMLPSYQEGFSIALLESTMLGKAIIASAVDSNPEMIIDHKNGLLVPPREPLALMQAMELLYQDRALKAELESRARTDYERHYQLEDIVQQQIIPMYHRNRQIPKNTVQ